MEALSIVAIVIAVAAVAVAAFALWRLSAVQRQAEQLDSTCGELNEQLHGLTAGAVGQRQQIGRLHDDISRLRDRLEAVADSGGAGGAVLDQAIRMAKKGMGAAEIMETCGLSQMEADLVVLLHRERRSETY
ncbi:MAG: DUF2802 domain-containing protein [Ectothiorhodospiraceae bacterium]|jgi:uncharacterized protein YoxC